MHKRDQLDQRIADCLNHFDRFWIFTSILLAGDDLEQENEDVFESGNIDQWAAGLIYAVSRHNELDMEKVDWALTLKDICSFYEIEEHQALEKANEIKEALSLDHENENYQEFDFSYLEEEEDLIFDINDRSNETWMSAEVEFKYKSRINRRTKLQLEELTRRIVVEVNEDENEDEFLSIIDIEAKGSQLIIQLTGYDGDIDFFCHLMEEQHLVFKGLEVLSKGENLYIPTKHYALFMEQHEAMNLEEKQFNSLEEIQRELDAKFKGKTLDEIKSANPLSPEGKALVDSIKAFSLPKYASIERINQILAEQPNCVEAHICLAGWETDSAKRITMLETALTAGDATLDIAEIDRKKSWWGDHRTRPYMRAMQLLAHELYQKGEEEKGIDMLWELIEMNEGDNQGNRLSLLELCIVKKQWHEVRELLTKYPDDQSLTFIYGKAIYLYYTLGNKSRTKKALIRAYQRNKYPMRLLAGIEEYPDPGEYFTFGDVTEATQVLDFLLACFEKDQKLVSWIFDVLIKSGVWEDDVTASNQNPFRISPDAKIIPFDRRSEN